MIYSLTKYVVEPVLKTALLKTWYLQKNVLDGMYCKVSHRCKDTMILNGVLHQINFLGIKEILNITVKIWAAKCDLNKE